MGYSHFKHPVLYRVIQIRQKLEVKANTVLKISIFLDEDIRKPLKFWFFVLYLFLTLFEEIFQNRKNIFIATFYQLYNDTYLTPDVSSVGSHQQLYFLLWTPYWVFTRPNTAFNDVWQQLMISFINDKLIQ